MGESEIEDRHTISNPSVHYFVNAELAVMKKTFTIISILLLAIAVYFGVNVFYEIMMSGSDNDQQSKLSEEQLSPPTDEKSPPLSDYKKITERNLSDLKRNACGGIISQTTWLISRRWPSGSRKKHRISAPKSTGGVKNLAPRDFRIS